MSNSLFAAALEQLIRSGAMSKYADEGFMAELHSAGRYRLLKSDTLPNGYKPARALLVPVCATEQDQRRAFNDAREAYNRRPEKQRESFVKRTLNKNTRRDMLRRRRDDS